jgi:hypothetical protein
MIISVSAWCFKRNKEPSTCIGSFPRVLFKSVIPSVMRENADESVFQSVIEPPPDYFSRAIAYVIA